MTQSLTSQAEASSTFLHRVLWWLAAIILLRGAIGLVGEVFTLAFNVRWTQFRPAYLYGSIYFFIVCLWIGLNILGIISSIAFFRRYSWGRRSMIAWAITFIILMLLQHINSVAAYTSAYRSTTQPAQYSIGYLAFYYLIDWIEKSVFPVFVLSILFQRQVADAFHKKSDSGFEVLPMARLATTVDSPDKIK
jgi:hypothetical protein